MGCVGTGDIFIDCVVFFVVGTVFISCTVTIIMIVVVIHLCGDVIEMILFMVMWMNDFPPC